MKAPVDSKGAAIRDELRKIIRAYYNSTFEYGMEQLAKGDIASAIADAETKQSKLDDPYLDQILAILAQEVKRVIGEDEFPGNALGGGAHMDARVRNDLREEQHRKAGLV